MKTTFKLVLFVYISTYMLVYLKSYIQNSQFSHLETTFQQNRMQIIALFSWIQPKSAVAKRALVHASVYHRVPHEHTSFGERKIYLGSHWKSLFKRHIHNCNTPIPTFINKGMENMLHRCFAFYILCNKSCVWLAALHANWLFICLLIYMQFTVNLPSFIYFFVGYSILSERDW